MTASKIVAAAASGAGGGTTDVDDVFSTDVYDGTGSSQSINNGIDLAGEGGMVWGKGRSNVDGHWMVDSERGKGSNNNFKYLRPESSGAEIDLSSRSLSSFNNNGFTFQAGDDQFNGSGGIEYCTWTFRKAEKFMDVVTFTGSGSGIQTVNHNLGVAPGMMFVKKTSGTGDWLVWHQNLTNTHDKYVRLNLVDAEQNYDNVWGENGYSPTSTQFKVQHIANESGSYVAYLFAHNNNDGEFGPDSDQDIIKCGFFETSNNSNRQDVDLGFEPQFVLLKNITNNTSGDWWLMDEIRGMTGGDGNDVSYLRVNSTGAEADFGTDTFYKYGSGFGVVNNAFATNVRFVYMAIRRGPLSPPTAASEVFHSLAYTGNGTANRKITTNFQVDTNLIISREANAPPCLASRLRNGMFETHTSDNTYGTLADWLDWAHNDGIDLASVYQYDNNNGDDFVMYNWKRAPKYFDVTVHKSNGQPQQQVPHNLEVVPEMAWIKAINSSNNWFIYHSGLTSGKNLIFNSVNAETQSNANQATAFTSTYWTPGDNGGLSGGANNTFYMAWLFATLAGVTKVGSYTGNGSSLSDSQNIDCGFSNGAKFVLIKCSSHGDRSWMVFDSSRGINAGADPFVTLNSSSAENYAFNGAGSEQNYTSNNFDLIDPYSSGFTVVGGTGMVNENGKSYIFYAVAA